MDINTIFSRRLLKLAHDDIRKAFPDVRVNEAASITGYRPHWFVQIEVEGYPPFDREIKAHDRYEAKAKAWSAFFEAHAPEQVKRELEAAQ